MEARSGSVLHETINTPYERILERLVCKLPPKVVDGIRSKKTVILQSFEESLRPPLFGNTERAIPWQKGDKGLSLDESNSIAEVNDLDHLEPSDCSEKMVPNGTPLNDLGLESSQILGHNDLASGTTRSLADHHSSHTGRRMRNSVSWHAGDRSSKLLVNDFSVIYEDRANAIAEVNDLDRLGLSDCSEENVPNGTPLNDFDLESSYTSGYNDLATGTTRSLADHHSSHTGRQMRNSVSWHAGDSSSRFLVNDFSVIYEDRGVVGETAARIELPPPRTADTDIFLDAECLVICSYGLQEYDNPNIRATPKRVSIHGGREEEIVSVVDILSRAKHKGLASLVPFRVEGSGNITEAWVDDEKVAHSKGFYLTLIEDFLERTKAPAAVIWYSGHGEDATGNWCFRDGTICFREIFHLYQAHFKHKLLYIISDCSYSGCWIQDMACMLDDMGIPPCGHHTREQGILLKLWTSCHSCKQETFVRYVMEDVRLRNDGILIHQPQKSDELHNQPFLHTTIVTCPSKDFNCCALSKKDFLKKWRKWKYRAQDVGSLLHLVRGTDNGKSAWHYVMVEPTKLNMFKEQVSTGTIEISKFGEILVSGWGKDPPKDVKCAVDSFFTL